MLHTFAKANGAGEKRSDAEVQCAVRRVCNSVAEVVPCKARDAGARLDALSCTLVCSIVSLANAVTRARIGKFGSLEFFGSLGSLGCPFFIRIRSVLCIDGCRAPTIHSNRSYFNDCITISLIQEVSFSRLHSYSQLLTAYNQTSCPNKPPQ